MKGSNKAFPVKISSKQTGSDQSAKLPTIKPKKSASKTSIGASKTAAKPSMKTSTATAKGTTARSSKKSKLAQPPYNLFQERILHNPTDLISNSDTNPNTAGYKKTFQEGLQSAIHLLKGRKNIVVLCGAGISVSCGIPDFRSKGGIYDQIPTNELGLCTPEEIFHLEIFQEDPRPFYKFAGEMLYPEKPRTPSPSHRFLALLEQNKQLLRVYTQNIDGLEEKAGVSKNKVVNAHGSLKTSKCLKCGKQTDADCANLRKEVLKGCVPLCQRITGKRKRRRDEISSLLSDGGVEDDKVPVKCGGVMKPNITFFGEPLTDRVRRCLEADQKKADCVIVMGTSLSVAPISKVIQYLKPSIPRLLINRTIVIPKHADGSVDLDDDGHEENGNEKEQDHRDGYLFDALFLGFCDEVTKALTYVMANEENKNSVSTTTGKSTIKEKKDSKKLKFSKVQNSKKIPKQKECKVFPFQSQDCEMLCNIEDEKLKEMGGNLNCLFHHPSDRILMFPGAKLQSIRQEDELSYHEVVHCDECHCVIKGKILKCADCFDYDLCTKCFDVSSKKHHGGNHKFIEEIIM